MPVVNTEGYKKMLDNAKDNGFAYPAVNVVNSEGVNAALLAFKEANCDGIIQVSTGVLNSVLVSDVATWFKVQSLLLTTLALWLKTTTST